MCVCKYCFTFGLCILHSLAASPFFKVPEPPLIDLSNSKVYNEASICWRLPEDHQPTDHQILEYRRWAPKQRPQMLYIRADQIIQ